MTKPNRISPQRRVIEAGIAAAVALARNMTCKTDLPGVYSLWANLLRTVAKLHPHPKEYPQPPKPSYPPKWRLLEQEPQSIAAYWTARHILCDRNLEILRRIENLSLLSSTLAYHLHRKPNTAYSHISAVNQALRNEAQFITAAARLLSEEANPQTRRPVLLVNSPVTRVKIQREPRKMPAKVIT